MCLWTVVPGDEDLDTPTGTTARKRSGGDLWNKLNARGKRLHREQTLNRAFMRNFEKLAQQIRTESTSENNPVQRQADMKTNFRNFERKSLSTIVKMAKDDQYKDHILKRSKEARKKWQRGFAKLRGGQFQFRNLVQEAKEKKEEEKQEQEMERVAEATAERETTSAARGGNYLSPVAVERPFQSPASSSFRNSRRRQQVPGEGDGHFARPAGVATDYPGYAGGRSPNPDNRLSNRRSSGHYEEEESATSEVFNF